MDALSSHVTNFMPQINCMNNDSSVNAVTPSHHATNKNTAKDANDQTQRLVTKSIDGYNVSNVLSHSLVGKCKFHRTLTCVNSNKGSIMNNCDIEDDEHACRHTTCTPQQDNDDDNNDETHFVNSLRYREGKCFCRDGKLTSILTNFSTQITCT